MGVPTELINIIIGTIILFTAVPLVFRIIRAKFRNRKNAKNQLANAEKIEKPIKEVKEKEVLEDKTIDKEETEILKKDEVKEEIKSDSNPRVINETGEEIIIRTVDKEEE